MPLNGTLITSGYKIELNRFKFKAPFLFNIFKAAIAENPLIFKIKPTFSIRFVFAKLVPSSA